MSVTGAAAKDSKGEPQQGNGEFTHILRILATNVDGRRMVPYALRDIKGCGKRFSVAVCKKADIDPTKRAGELSNEEIDKLVAVIQNPREHKVPDWFLNRTKDIVDGKTTQITSNGLAAQLRYDLTR